MKKLFVLLILVAGMAAFTFSQDTIVYHYGAESVVVSPGDSLNNLIFSETVDGFARLQDMNGMVQYSSNGKSFWLKDIRLDEDTLANTIKILSAIVVADPTLVAVVVPPTTTGDDRVGPDENDPDDSSQGWPWQLTVGLGILGCLTLYSFGKKFF